MKSVEELLLRVINKIAEKFKDKMVLKGGMLLRLYNSPRSTTDGDFVLITKESRKIWKDKIIRSLREIAELEIGEVSLNSRGIFIELADSTNELHGLLEINLLPATCLPPEPVSTANLSAKYSLGGQVIASMAVPEAFAHKIAATLERDAIRDLYDLSQWEAMGSFDVPTLKNRLSQLSIRKNKPIVVSFQEAANLLRNKIEGLDQKIIEQDLYPFLPPEYRPGVLNLIRAAGGRIIEQMIALEDTHK